jgi:hypothetical protein
MITNYLLIKRALVYYYVNLKLGFGIVHMYINVTDVSPPVHVLHNLTNQNIRDSVGGLNGQPCFEIVSSAIKKLISFFLLRSDTQQTGLEERVNCSNKKL